MADEPSANNSGRKKTGPASLCTPEVIAKAGEAYALGATDQQVAELIGVAVRTISTWKVTKPDFAKACKLNKDLADDRVEQTLYLKATGQIEGVPPDTTAMIFWLKNRRRTEWRDVKQLGNDPENPLPGTAESEDTVKRIAERLRAMKLDDGTKGADLV